MRLLRNHSILSLLSTFLLILSVGIGLSPSARAENQRVKIVPINYEAADQVLTLLNKTSEAINLAGYKIRTKGGKVFEFSQDKEKAQKIAPFGVLRIHSGPGAEEVYQDEGDLFWTKESVWDGEKTAQLLNPKGEVVFQLSLAQVGKVDQLAGCLARKEAVIYGLKTCPHCQTQKDKFSSSAKYLNYVECSANRRKCLKDGIRSVPAWHFGKRDRRVVGAKSLDKLSQFAGCNYHD